VEPGRVSRWTPVVLYMAFIFGLSSVSTPPALPQGTDKDLHALLYAGLGIVLVRALAGGVRRRVTGGVAILAVVIATLYGVTDEFHQYFVPPRQVEALDVAADGIGAAVSAIGAYLWARLAERTRGGGRG
jgi:VanZ family protein